MLALESAAVRTTKFMIVAAAGTPAAEKTRTNGLSVTSPPCAVVVQGTTVSTTAMAST